MISHVRIISLIVVACFMTTCATTTAKIPREPPKAVALDALPEDPGKQPLPPDRNWVMGVSGPDDLHGKEGILMSDEKAARLGQYQVGYSGLRAEYELDRKLWIAKENIYLKNLWEADKKIEDMLPGWWTQNKGTLGFVAGFVMAAILAIGLVYGIDQADQPAQ